ncbi:MAG: 23S rRNA (guanine(2445)-N(2))/(guanine(2069)-N(7))-methyltransferase, partial [Halieaceae bacterium]|nr:23S rRNA (guanine(2445)-N(2))/(guanine(2069)-N(7))-methyltransferase [Halieaceae bacterium]
MVEQEAASQWFAACPRGLENLLVAELESLGALSTRETVAGVYFQGPTAIGYRACLWSRLANRILRPVDTIEAKDGDELYSNLKLIAWSSLFDA